MKFLATTTLLLAALAVAPVEADNRSINGMFTNGLPLMSGGVENCDETRDYPYVQIGAIEVSITGQYQFEDLAVGAPGSIDSLLLVYEGTFDANDRNLNLIAAIDWQATNQLTGFDYVELNAGTDYLLVAQPWCPRSQTEDQVEGVFAFSMRGEGEITGAGYPTPPQFVGNFASVGDVADFPEFGPHKYVTYSFTAQETGLFYFYDFGGFVWFNGSPAGQIIYTDFDPDNPGSNQITTILGQQGVFLSQGQTVDVVYFDFFDNDGIYETTIYPPGELVSLNYAVTGSFYNPTMSGQGALLEADDSDLLSEPLLFGSLYTYQSVDQAPAESEGVGSADQRWLTFFGTIPESGTSMEVKFENSTGGRFDAPLPAVTRDEEYGTGTLTMHDCKTMTLTYDLPDVGQGMFEWIRILPGLGKRCAEFVAVDPPLSSL